MYYLHIWSVCHSSVIFHRIKAMVAYFHLYISQHDKCSDHHRGIILPSNFTWTGDDTLLMKCNYPWETHTGKLSFFCNLQQKVAPWWRQSVGLENTSSLVSCYRYQDSALHIIIYIYFRVICFSVILLARPLVLCWCYSILLSWDKIEAWLQLKLGSGRYTNTGAFHYQWNDNFVESYNMISWKLANQEYIFAFYLHLISWNNRNCLQCIINFLVGNTYTPA